MTKQIQKNDLGWLGEDYQRNLVKMFIEDKSFFKNIECIVDQNMFTVDVLKRIVGLMKERYALNETVPNYRELDVLIRSKISDSVTLERCLSTLEAIKNEESMGIDIIENSAEKFFKQQNLVKAINKAQEIIKKGDSSKYDEIEDIIKKALHVNNHKEFGYKIFDNLEEVLSEEYRLTIPTGADKLDEALNGGLGKGELGIIIAPSSVGKTSATTGFAAHAAITKTDANNNMGYKVLHIHFEDEDVNIKRKYYAFLTNFDACELSKPEIRPQAINIINNHEYKEMIQRNVIGYHPNSGEFSPTDLKVKIQQLIATGFKPDLIIVDYFECLKLEQGHSIDEKEYSREGITMRKLEAIAHEFNVALWCPVQGTKDSFNQQIVGMSQAGGSVKKVQIGHVVISFARTEQMRLEDKLNIFINKFRPGRIRKNSFMNITFNNGTTRFDFSTETDVDNAIDGTNKFQTQVAKEVKQNIK